MKISDHKICIWKKVKCIVNNIESYKYLTKKGDTNLEKILQEGNIYLEET